MHATTILAQERVKKQTDEVTVQTMFTAITTNAEDQLQLSRHNHKRQNAILASFFRPEHPYAGCSIHIAVGRQMSHGTAFDRNLVYATGPVRPVDVVIVHVKGKDVSRISNICGSLRLQVERGDVIFLGVSKVQRLSVFTHSQSVRP